MKELLVVDVHCDYTDLKKFRSCDAWVVENAEFNTDLQVGEVRLRQFSVMKDM